MSMFIRQAGRNNTERKEKKHTNTHKIKTLTSTNSDTDD